MKNHLFRDRAPITEAGWEEIEKEARRTLRALLEGEIDCLVANTYEMRKLMQTPFEFQRHGQSLSFWPLH